VIRADRINRRVRLFTQRNVAAGLKQRLSPLAEGGVGISAKARMSCTGTMINLGSRSLIAIMRNSFGACPPHPNRQIGV
jgi:hypothetical protein